MGVVMAAKAVKRAAGGRRHASHCNAIGFPHSLGRCQPIAIRRCSAMKRLSRDLDKWLIVGELPTISEVRLAKVVC